MKRILLVDDESDVCFVLENVLIEYGFVVDSYENPTLALDESKPDLYNLLDIMMSDLNGFALYREIKRLKELGKASKQDHNHQETTLAMIQRLLFFATLLFTVVAFEIRPYNQFYLPKRL